LYLVYYSFGAKYNRQTRQFEIFSNKNISRILKVKAEFKFKIYSTPNIM